MSDILIGPSEGNSGAIIRWGKMKDNGVWFIQWKFRNIYRFKFDFKNGHVRLWFLDIHWSNPASMDEAGKDGV